jgi:DNA replication protein DnaC
MTTQDETEYLINHAREWVAASAGIPPLHLPDRFENFETPTEEHRRVLDTVRNFSSTLRSHCRSMVLVGVPGGGKTHLAVSIIWDNALIYPTYLNTVDFMADIRASWDRKYSDQPTEAELLAKALNRNLLVMDDVGCGQDGGDFERRILSRILCSRHENRLPTILATNLTIDVLKPLIGERAADRLAETADIVITPGISWRRAQARNGAATILDPTREG